MKSWKSPAGAAAGSLLARHTHGQASYPGCLDACRKRLPRPVAIVSTPGYTIRRSKELQHSTNGSKFGVEDACSRRTAHGVAAQRDEAQTLAVRIQAQAAHTHGHAALQTSVAP